MCSCVCASVGAHQGQRDRVRGRGRLLSRLECDRLDCQRRECAPFDAPAGANDAAEHDGHPASARDFERAHDHFGHNAGECVRRGEQKKNGIIFQRERNADVLEFVCKCEGGNCRGCLLGWLGR